MRLISTGGGGTYIRPPNRYPGETGGLMTAYWTLDSFVLNIGGKWLYDWELTNTGTGDIYAWWGPNPPNFVNTVNEEFGDPEIDGSAGPDADLSTAPTSNSDSLIGGPPIIAFYKLGFNPDTEQPGQYLTPVPEPGTILLLGVGMFGLVAIGVKRRRKKMPISDRPSEEI